MPLTLYPNPYDVFQEWFQLAQKKEAVDPNAMTLATVDEDLQPAARTVLLKEWDEDGFVFYTNYQSRKAHAINANPKAALLFYWKSLSRQIRIEGAVHRVSAERSDAYFATRPRDSQVGAWASKQSAPMDDRGQLADRIVHYKNEFDGMPIIPRPEWWGGYCVKPNRMEFWMAGENRLHERAVYIKEGVGWQSQLLYP